MAERLPQMLELARSLIPATDEGRVPWTRHDTRRAQFDTTVAGTCVSIASADVEGAHPFTLVLWEPHEAGQAAGVNSAASMRPLEKLTTHDLLDGAPEYWVRILARLWRVARTQALRIDERLDAVLAELDAGTPFRPARSIV